MLVVVLQAVTAFASDFRTVALSNAAALGTPGESYAGFGAPKLNLNGQTAFTAELTGPGVGTTNNAGIWSEGLGSLELVARTGDMAPGTSAVFKTFLSVPKFNALGQTAFRAGLIGAGVTEANDQGIWSEGKGPLALVARSNEPAPGTNGLVFTRPTFMHPKLPPSIDPFGDPGLNDVGQIAFHAYLPSIALDSFANGIWSEGTGSLDSVARSFDTAPGTGRATFLGVGPIDVSIYALWQVVFGGSLTGPGVTPANAGGTWLQQNGTISLFARRGDAAPEIPGATLSGISEPRFNNAGQFSFFSTLIGPGITSSTDRAIWSNGGGTLKLLIRAGDTAPGTGGAKFDPQSSRVIINDQGETLFFSSLTGPGITMDNGFGIWVGKDGISQLVVRRGDIAPGAGGALFSFISTGSVDLNALGQTAFHSLLTGPGVTTANRWGIWGEDLDGVLKLIVRSGDSLEVAPGDFRVIASLGLAEGGFNDRGQLAFRASFTDGTDGIFISNLIAVPEPSSLAILWLFVLRPNFSRIRACRLA